MKLSKVCRVLESTGMGLKLGGFVPDISLLDAIAVGILGSTYDLISNITEVEVVLPHGRMTTWNWTKNTSEMQSLCCGFGMMAVVLTVTIKCVPLTR